MDGEQHAISTDLRRPWEIWLRWDGRVELSSLPSDDTSVDIELRPSVPDDEVVRIIAAVCAPDLFGGAG
jgi:hypothetical protein